MRYLWVVETGALGKRWRILDGWEHPVFRAKTDAEFALRQCKDLSLGGFEFRITKYVPEVKK